MMNIQSDNWIKSNWYLLIGFMLGIFVLGYLPYQFLVIPNMPYVIVDKEVVVNNSIGYATVEMTGKNPNDGEIVTVCSLPKDYLPYVHNRQMGDWDLLNPQSKLNLGIRYGSPALFIGVIAWFVYKLIKLKFKKKKGVNL